MVWVASFTYMFGTASVRVESRRFTYLAISDARHPEKMSRCLRGIRRQSVRFNRQGSRLATDVRRCCHTRVMATHSLLELTLFVTDVDESAAFYRAMGITLFNDDHPGRPHLVDGQIGNTGTVLQLFPAGNRPTTRVQLGFRVTDVATVAAELTSLGIEYEIPGARRLRTMDPNGNRVHLTDVIR